MNQLWQFWKGTLSEQQVNQIIDIGEQSVVGDPNLGFEGNVNNSDYRSSTIHWINATTYANLWIVDLLWYYAQEANKNAFGFDVNYLNDIQYTKYNSEQLGRYEWHCDTFWANPTCFDRKISIVIQLSDSSDYEGGNFEIDTQYPQLPVEDIRTKGTVIVFPSFINHRVTTVTSGTRKSLVSWVQGPKFR